MSHQSELPATETAEKVLRQRCVAFLMLWISFGHANRRAESGEAASCCSSPHSLLRLDWRQNRNGSSVERME
jgi:hypothetical protein